MSVINVTTITEDIKKKLLKVQGREKKPHLLMEACKPTTGADEALKELIKERKRDEERAKRYP